MQALHFLRQAGSIPLLAARTATVAPSYQTRPLSVRTSARISPEVALKLLYNKASGCGLKTEERRHHVTRGRAKFLRKQKMPYYRYKVEMGKVMKRLKAQG